MKPLGTDYFVDFFDSVSLQCIAKVVVYTLKIVSNISLSSLETDGRLINWRYNTIVQIRTVCKNVRLFTLIREVGLLCRTVVLVLVVC